MPQIIELQSFLLIIVKIFPGGSMGEIIGRGMPNILLFILYHKGQSLYGGRRDLSFT